MAPLPHTFPDHPPLVPALARSRPVGWLAAVAARWGPWSTPAALRTFRLVITMLFALAGVLGVTAAAAGAATVQDIATRIEPLSADTATVYRAFADADAAVIGGFVDGAGQTGTLRARVDNDLAVAADGLVRAAERAEDPATIEAVARLSRLLPDYAGRVELARAVGQSDPLAGEAALRRASDLMQTTMLPVAESLLQRQAQLLDEAYPKATAFPTALLVVALALALVLIVMQVWTAQRFHRGLNLGMVIATAAVAVGALWWVAAGTVSGHHIAASRAHAQAISDTLVPAQVTVLQARTAEGLALVERDTGRRELEFDDRMRRLGGTAQPTNPDGTLDTAARMVTDPLARTRLREATAAAADYRDAHEQVRRATAEGRSADAARLALGTEPSSAAVAFGRLDANLAAALDAERASFARQAAQAGRWSNGSDEVAVLMALLGIGATAFGVAPRLREYP